MSLKESLLKVQSAVTKVHKDGKNPHMKSSYPTLESVLDVLNGPLQDAGVVLTQHTQKKDGEWVLTTTVCTKDIKECESFDAPLLGLEGSKNPMQALGSAITYARRYSLMNYFKLAATDDDGEAAGKDALSIVKEKKPHQKPADKVQDLKIGDGKFKGMWVSEVPPEDLKSYIHTINGALKEAGQNEPKWFQELKKVAGE